MMEGLVISDQKLMALSHGAKWNTDQYFEEMLNLYIGIQLEKP
jgi:hypothetical protein